MRQDGIFKHVVAVFVIAVVFYFASFAWLDHRRTRNGPWEVTFQGDAAGIASLSVSERKLNISRTISFPHGKTTSNLSRTLVFSESTTNLPFGELAFQDPTFLPGTVTMKLFGHMVELLPRALFIDKKEYPWTSTEPISLP